MRNKIKTFLLALLLLGNLMPFSTVYAQGLDCQKDPSNYACSGVSNQIAKYLCTPHAPDPNQTNFTDGLGDFQGQPSREKEASYNNTNKNVLYECINRMYRFSIVLASIIGVFFIVIAGYVYMGSEGNQESVEKAKSIIGSTLASIVILFAGYVLLRAINPDLIKFQNIQPPSVVGTDLPNWEAQYDTAGRLISINSPAGSFKPLATNTATRVETEGGCGLQNSKLMAELSGIQVDLFDAVIEICKAGKAKGAIQISSVASGSHASNSYHYKFCAVDFADGTGNFLNNAGGKAALAKAEEIKRQKTYFRINPGVDQNEKNHMHIDVGQNCLN